MREGEKIVSLGRWDEEVGERRWVRGGRMRTRGGSTDRRGGVKLRVVKGKKGEGEKVAVVQDK